MEHSQYTYDPSCTCGSRNPGLAGSLAASPTRCGCQGGLGETPTGQNEPATETSLDLLKEAKKYINGEIPTKFKIAAAVGVTLLLLLATRGN